MALISAFGRVFPNYFFASKSIRFVKCYRQPTNSKSFNVHFNWTSVPIFLSPSSLSLSLSFHLRLYMNTKWSTIECLNQYLVATSDSFLPLFCVAFHLNIGNIQYNNNDQQRQPIEPFNHHCFPLCFLLHPFSFSSYVHRIEHKRMIFIWERRLHIDWYPILLMF